MYKCVHILFCLDQYGPKTNNIYQSDIVTTKQYYEINNSIKCCKQDDINNNNFSSPEFFIEMLLQLPPKISRLISEVKRNRKHINLVDKERDNLVIQLATLTKTYEKGGYGMSSTSTMGADTVAADDHSLELIRLRKVCKSMEVERLSLIQNLEKSEELRKQQEDVILVLQRCTLQGNASEVTTCDERYKIVEMATTAALPSLPVPPERIRSQKDRSNQSLLRSNVASCEIGTNLVTTPASSALNTEPALSGSPTHSKSTMTQPRRRSLASTRHTKTQYDRDRMVFGTAASARRRISKHNTLEPCGPRSRKTIFS